MKGKGHIQSFNEHGENLNSEPHELSIPGVSNGKKEICRLLSVAA